MGLIEVQNLKKNYVNDEVVTPVLHNISFKIDEEEFVAIMGPSGSGKSTLMHILSFLDRPTSGLYEFEGKDTKNFDDNYLARLRNEKVGFVFQSFNLIPVLTAFENVEYMLLLQGVGPAQRRERVMQGLALVGLAGLETRFPSQLSGGQQQRVAVARAMITNPDIVLADEPTANLDSTAGSALIDLMHQLNQTTGRTFVFSTHDKMIMERAQRLILLKDGQIDQDQ